MGFDYAHSIIQELLSSYLEFGAQAGFERLYFDTNKFLLRRICF